MEERFYLDVHIKVSKGWISYARFNLGSDQDFAHSLLDVLAGRTIPKGFLRLNLMERRDDIALVHKSMYCTLSELAENSMLITKEVFKFYNLDEGY